MSADSGLSPHPWVSIAVSAGEVSVDGLPLPSTGTLEDRYLAALQHVAANVAAPLGRQVGVTVRDGAGVVTHLAISPEGQATAIEDLVRDASAPVSAEGYDAGPPAVGPRAASPVREEPTGDGAPRTRRRAWWSAAAVLAVLGGVLTASAFSAAEDGSDPQTQASPRPSPAAPTETITARAVVTRWRQPRGGLVGEAVSPKKGVLHVQLGATRTPVRVVVTITTSTGQTLSKTVILHRGLRTVPWADLPGGTADWSATARGLRPLTGTILVRGPIPSPAPTSYPSPSPTAATHHGGKHHHHPTGPGEVPPTAPIDPDDL